MGLSIHQDKQQLKTTCSTEDLTWSSLEKTLKQMSGNYDPYFDGRVDINIKDNVEAYLTIIPSKTKGSEITPEDIKNAFRKKGIVQGDLEIAIEALKKGRYKTPILIAKGIRPIPGKDAKLIYQYGFNQPGSTAIPGQLLAVKEPCVPGTPGISVQGISLPPPLPRDIELIAGINTTISEDGLRVYATDYGEVVWTGNRVEVEKILRIPGNVSIVTGDIEFDGKVIIGGGVEDGYKVKATGSIEIRGTVGRAYIESGGDILIGQGVSGKNDGRILAEGKVIAGFAENVYIQAKKGVFIKESILNAHIITKGTISVELGRGLILGGELIAGKAIVAKTIGSTKQIKTTLKIGKVKETNGKLYFAEQTLEDTQKNNWSLSVLQRIFPGIKLYLGNQSITILITSQKITYKTDGKRILSVPYQAQELNENDIEDPISANRSGPLHPPCVVVSADSEEEAKRLGAIYLGFSEKSVDIREIPPDPEWDNETEPLQFYVFQKGVNGPWRKELGEVVDGFFKFDNREDGIYLWVFPPDEGEKVKFEDVVAEIDRMNLYKIDFGKVNRAIKESKGIPVKIGPTQFIPGFDGEVYVNINEEETAAEITLIPPKEGGLPLKFERVIESLKRAGVKVGIKYNAIRESLEKEEYFTPILAAEAIPPVPGKDARIEKLIKPAEYNPERFIDKETGRINFKELGLINNVRVGQLLARKIPIDSLGKPGKLVTEKEIPPPYPKDVSLESIAGMNTKISEDGLRLYSTINGQAVFEGKTINILPIYQVMGDVNLRTGNIDFAGTVIISGNVDNAFCVKAEGDIIVYKNVGNATLHAKGNVVVGGGVSGSGKTTIIAGKDIISKFIENASIKANGDVVVGTELMHSFVWARKRVILKGKKATIVGGEIKAGKEIIVRVVGTVAEPEVKLKAGFDPWIEERIIETDKKILETRKQLSSLKKEIKTLRELKNIYGILTPEKKIALDLAKEAEQNLSQRIRFLISTINELESKLRPKSAKIVVMEKIYPGARVWLRTHVERIEEEEEGVIFWLEGSRFYKKYLPSLEDKKGES